MDKTKWKRKWKWKWKWKLKRSLSPFTTPHPSTDSRKKEKATEQKTKHNKTTTTNSTNLNQQTTNKQTKQQNEKKKKKKKRQRLKYSSSSMCRHFISFAPGTCPKRTPLSWWQRRWFGEPSCCELVAFRQQIRSRSCSSVGDGLREHELELVRGGEDGDQSQGLVQEFLQHVNVNLRYGYQTNRKLHGQESNDFALDNISCWHLTLGMEHLSI